MLWAFKGHLPHTKEKSVKFNSSFYKKMDIIATPTSRRAVADLSKKTAHWGIKGQGDLPMIMGVLEFGDPAHTFPNYKKSSPHRKALEDVLAAFGGENASAIPPRPWLSKSTRGTYRSHLTKYINDNLPKVLAGFPKYGQNIVNPEARMSAEKFIEGLAKVGRNNAEMSWNYANFEKNRPATLANKTDPRPLHGNGDGDNPMSGDAITAWSD